MTDHLAKVEVTVFAQKVEAAEASGAPGIVVELYMAQNILRDLRAKDGDIPTEWRVMLHDLQQDLEIMTRVRNKLLKKVDDMRAEFSAKENELQMLRALVEKKVK